MGSSSYFENFFNKYNLDLLPWLIGFVVALIALYIFAMFFKSAVARKVRGINAAGMKMQDLDKMKKGGLVSPEEFTQIRRALANRELTSQSERDRLTRERAIITAAAADPDAPRQLLDPKGSSAVPAPPPVQSAPPPPAEAQPPRRPDAAVNAPWGDPLAGASAVPSTPPPPPQEGELEVLLKKGVITPEQYATMKKLAKGG